MADRLKGKVALITGGAGGIGRATAEVFCSEGARVGVVDREGSHAEEVVAALVSTFGPDSALCVHADVSDEHAARDAMAAVVERFGSLSTLINNAGIREYGPLADASTEAWRRILEVNLLGTSHCTRAALPLLRQVKGSAIVIVSSAYALVGRRGMGLYDATKAALVSYTRTLAWEEARNGIRVNAVCPGGTLTPYQLETQAAAGRSPEEVRSEKRSTSLLGRWGEPVEIAWPILWLVSDEASFVTGTALMVDGGTSAM